MSINLSSKIILAPLFIALLVNIGACSRYSVSINENVVYQPPQVFSAYNISDAGLKSCVQSTIAEKKLTRAEQLKTLLCPAGNIAALHGLETFGAIEFLGLDDNKLTNLENLSGLSKLKQLSIKNNEVVDFSPLARLNDLVLLEASGNGDANCGSLSNFTSNSKIALPAHCRAE